MNDYIYLESGGQLEIRPNFEQRPNEEFLQRLKCVNSLRPLASNKLIKAQALTMINDCDELFDGYK